MKKLAKIILLAACVVLMLALVSCLGKSEPDYNATSKDGEGLAFYQVGSDYWVMGLSYANQFVSTDVYKTIIIPAEYNGLPVTCIECLGLEHPYGYGYSLSPNHDLEFLEIPHTVSRINISELSDCSNLKSVKVDENNPYYKDIDGVLYTKDGTELLCYPRGKVNRFYEIPDSVTSIGDYAFSGCTSLTSVVIPDEVTIISNYAFNNCTSLENIEVDANNAYYKSVDGILYTKDGKTLVCYPAEKNNASFIIPNSVTSIGDYAFYGCTSLESIIVPDSVTSIGDYAFYGCTSLNIYCEAPSEPTDWDSDWNRFYQNGEYTIPVVWGWGSEE